MVRRGLADSIDKKPQVAGLLFLQMVAGRAFFVGYPVFVPGFGFQRVLNDLERLSRAMFPIWAKECLSNSISQDYLRYRWLLRYVGRVKTRWGGWGLIGKRRLGCPSPYQAAQAYGAYYLE